MTMIRNGVAVAALMMSAAPAGAQAWSARVGGFMIAGVGYVDSEFHESGMTVVNDAEVHFNFRLTADNGLTFGAKFELEGSGVAGNMDEFVATVAGGFGRIEIGAEDGAGDRLLLTPPGCNLSCAGDGDGFLFDYAEGAAGDAINNEGDDSSDDLKITYFTPSFSGFRAGVSYGPTGDDEGPASDPARDDAHFEAGARLDIDIGDVMQDEGAEWAISGSYFAVNNLEDYSFSVATEVDAYGFGVGGRYTYLEVDDENNFSVGLSYGTGPWFAGVNYTQVIESDARAEDFAISAEVNYALAPGVTLAGMVEYADYEFADPAEERDGGFAVGVLTELNF